ELLGQPEVALGTITPCHHITATLSGPAPAPVSESGPAAAGGLTVSGNGPTVRNTPNTLKGPRPMDAAPIVRYFVVSRPPRTPRMGNPQRSWARLSLSGPLCLDPVRSGIWASPDYAGPHRSTCQTLHKAWSRMVSSPSVAGNRRSMTPS